MPITKEQVQQMRAFQNNRSGLGGQVDGWVNQTAQTLPALQPPQAAAPVPPVQTAIPAQPVVRNQPIKPVVDPSAFQQAKMDWRAGRSQFLPGAGQGVFGPEVQQQFQDWRQTRPQRQNFINKSRWPGATPVG